MNLSRVFVAMCLAIVAGCARGPEQTVCQRAETALTAGRLEEALTVLQDYLRQRPDAVRPLRLRVFVLLRAERLDLAKRALSDLPANDPVLLEALRQRDPVIRINAAKLLAEAPARWQLRALRRGLGDSAAEVRGYCVRALGKLAQRVDAKRLYRALQDENWRVRAEAADALAQLNDPRAAGWLIMRLRDGDGFVRYRCAAGLVAVASEANRPVLLEALGRTGPTQQVAIAMALAELHDPAALGPLTNELRNADREVRRQVIRALGVAGVASVTNELLQVVNGDDAELRELAVRAIEQLRP